jgi:hypothetical protein
VRVLDVLVIAAAGILDATGFYIVVLRRPEVDGRGNGAKRSHDGREDERRNRELHIVRLSR